MKVCQLIGFIIGDIFIKILHGMEDWDHIPDPFQFTKLLQLIKNQSWGREMTKNSKDHLLKIIRSSQTPNLS